MKSLPQISHEAVKPHMAEGEMIVTKTYVNSLGEVLILWALKKAEENKMICLEMLLNLPAERVVVATAVFLQIPEAQHWLCHPKLQGEF